MNDYELIYNNGRSVAKLRYEFAMDIFLPEILIKEKTRMICKCRTSPGSLSKHLAFQDFVDAINLENLGYVARPLDFFEALTASEILYQTIGYPECYEKGNHKNYL